MLPDTVMLEKSARIILCDLIICISCVCDFNLCDDSQAKHTCMQ